VPHTTQSQLHGFAPKWNNLPLLRLEDIQTTAQKKHKNGENIGEETPGTDFR
jgi:hypothetical protein